MLFNAILFYPSVHSFTVESGIVHDNQEEMPQIKKITKNPEVDTSFLPDRERDQRLAEEEERKHREWLEEQERIKKEVC